MAKFYPPPIKDPWITPHELSKWAWDYYPNKSVLREFLEYLRSGAIPIYSAKVVVTYRVTKKYLSRAQVDAMHMYSEVFGRGDYLDRLAKPKTIQREVLSRVDYSEDEHGAWLPGEQKQPDPTLAIVHREDERIYRQPLARFFIEHEWLIPPGQGALFRDAARGDKRAENNLLLERQAAFGAALKNEGITEDEWGCLAACGVKSKTDAYNMAKELPEFTDDTGNPIKESSFFESFWKKSPMFKIR